MEVGGALQPVDRLSDGSCPNCFPAGAAATLHDGSTRALSALAVGDQVQVGCPATFAVAAAAHVMPLLIQCRKNSH